MIATGQNNNAMNHGVLQVAQAYINGEQAERGHAESCRSSDPHVRSCLSCSTHAFGQMPLSIELVGPDGDRIDEIHR